MNRPAKLGDLLQAWEIEAGETVLPVFQKRQKSMITVLCRTNGIVSKLSVLRKRRCSGVKITGLNPHYSSRWFRGEIACGKNGIMMTKRRHKKRTGEKTEAVLSGEVYLLPLSLIRMVRLC
ncbi:MAG: hypothetical protein GX335_01430 [Firmicutes bacterium]|nr:hypothetical protein [Bacillota bacterium]